jgi:hypothetical protein
MLLSMNTCKNDVTDDDSYLSTLRANRDQDPGNIGTATCHDTAYWPITQTHNWTWIPTEIHHAATAPLHRDQNGKKKKETLQPRASL